MLSISSMFWKTLVALDFDEKLTQNIAQMTMKYHCGVDQVLSISKYDLANGRMACQQKH